MKKWKYIILRTGKNASGFCRTYVLCEISGLIKKTNKKLRF